MNVGDIVDQKIEEVQKLKHLKEEGSITKDECSDLIGDLLDVEKVNQLSDNIEERARLVRIFNNLREIVTTALSL